MTADVKRIADVYAVLRRVASRRVSDGSPAFEISVRPVAGRFLAVTARGMFRLRGEMIGPRGDLREVSISFHYTHDQLEHPLAVDGLVRQLAEGLTRMACGVLG